MNRSGLIVLAACALVAGCGDDNPTSPSAQPLVFTAILSPANEVPPVGNAESGGRGAAQITFDVTRNAANAITGGTVGFYFQVSGFPPGTTTTGAHIHPGAAGVNGPVVVSTGLTAAAPFALSTNGSGEFRASGITVDAALAQAIINNPAGYYFNMHSPLNPGGYARGQLTRIQ